MDKPIPISQVQKIAGHADLQMTQRCVQTHGIKDTGAGQWSREKRKAQQANKPEIFDFSLQAVNEKKAPISFNKLTRALEENGRIAFDRKILTDSLAN